MSKKKKKSRTYQPRSFQTPWLVLSGELCEVPPVFLEAMTRKEVLCAARETYRHLLGYDSPEINALYAWKILRKVDRAQDTEEARRLSLGLTALELKWPTTVQRARRQVEKAMRSC